MKKMIQASLSVAVSLALALPARAAVADHLQCFKIKDALAKTSYTVTLTPTDTNFPTAAGCTIKVPAKMLCVDVTKTNVVGNPPPGPVVGAPTDKFLCYKAKCPKASPTATVTDQFGTHQVTVKGTGLLCAPAPTPTTTTTASTTTTTGGCAQDLDCTPSGNQCEMAVCTAGVCGNQARPVGTACNQNGGTVCDANATCVQCVSAGNCPPSGNQCAPASCGGGICAYPNLPIGTACNQGGGTVCDANGMCVQGVVTADCPSSGNQCQPAMCNSETCSTVNAPQGLPCNQGGGQLCNGTGMCVQCITAGNCPPTGNQCVQATCSAQTCGTTFAPAGMACNQGGGTNCDGNGNCL